MNNHQVPTIDVLPNIDLLDPATLWRFRNGTHDLDLKAALTYILQQARFADYWGTPGTYLSLKNSARLFDADEVRARAMVRGIIQAIKTGFISTELATLLLIVLL